MDESTLTAGPLPFDTEAPPLRADAGGVVRIGNSRVTLDLVVAEYENGMGPEDMVRAYDTLKLADVHSAIAYYLNHREQVSAYLRQREEQAALLQARVEARQAAPSRSELQSRFVAGK